MPPLTARRLYRGTRRLLATVVALSLLTMPVTYRGGSDAAHAHTVFQLWGDIRSGSFTHHGERDDPAVAFDADAHAGEHAAGDHDGEAPGGHPEEAAHATVGEPAAPNRLAAGVVVDEDAPTVGSSTTTNVRGPMLVLPATVATPPLAESTLTPARRVSRLSGITLSPIIPPPRPASAA